ncbi:MAG: epoxyqueuosine reductase QueH [Fusobacteriaceae bacterium]
MKKNYDLIMQDILNNIDISQKKPSLFLHSCCAPCSSSVIEFLMNFFQITIFFYNPNITDFEEYEKRKIEHINYIKTNNLPVDFIDGDYNTQKDFFELVKGLENSPEGGDRCSICYQKRMEETCKMALKLNFKYFGTVLSISPMKNSEKINTIGNILEEKYNVNFLYSDFKKKGRFLRGIELSKKNNLYRQNYCGCIFSLR